MLSWLFHDNKQHSTKNQESSTVDCTSVYWGVRRRERGKNFGRKGCRGLTYSILHISIFMWTFLHEEEEGYSPFICTAACTDVIGCQKDAENWDPPKGVGNDLRMQYLVITRRRALDAMCIKSCNYIHKKNWHTLWCISIILRACI